MSWRLAQFTSTTTAEIRPNFVRISTLGTKPALRISFSIPRRCTSPTSSLPRLHLPLPFLPIFLCLGFRPLSFPLSSIRIVFRFRFLFILFCLRQRSLLLGLLLLLCVGPIRSVSPRTRCSHNHCCS